MIGTTVEMYDRCPEINGWAYWTWKRAATQSPDLAVIKIPKDWAADMTWIGGFFAGKRPESAAMQAGIREFLDAVDLKNCDYDTRMEKALLPKK